VEEVVIARAGRPIARLVPVRPTRRRRQPGRFAGQGRIASDFNAPLAPGILAGFLK
jgi:antitoxin (DNA-binding transcriptional repressor) of toxin-antitoxin stability system